ncbi:MAG: hypothetical protein R6X06_12775 [Gammaproteobacteria bacterium]
MRQWIVVSLILLSPSCFAEDRLEMQGTAIIGNQELPKVLYIVPWKKASLPDLGAPPLQSLIADALSPLERDEFRRQVQYYYQVSEQQKQDNENQ